MTNRVTLTDAAGHIRTLTPEESRAEHGTPVVHFFALPVTRASSRRGRVAGDTARRRLRICACGRRFAWAAAWATHRKGCAA